MTTITLADLEKCLSALEKLKQVRNELKGKLSGARNEDEEIKLAEDLRKVSENIKTLEDRKCWTIT